MKEKVGIVTQWFERGVSYVMQGIRNALAEEYDVFVLAYVSPLYGGRHLKWNGEWGVPNLTLYNEPKVSPSFFEGWVKENSISIVFFGDIHDFGLMEKAKMMDVKGIGVMYLESFAPALIPKYRLFDRIICPLEGTYNILKGFGLENAEFVRWGVDLGIFRPQKRNKEKGIRFFHPAGWGGVYKRRGTMFVIDAFKRMRNQGAELLIHAQFARKDREAENIKVVSGTIPRDELIRMYQFSDVAILPSKWEGLGLTFLEAMACGVAIITVDAPPMNEYVKDGENGFCCKVKERVKYPDIFIEGVHVDVDDMAIKMEWMIDRDIVSLMGQKSRECAETLYDWGKNSKRILDLVKGLLVENKVVVFSGRRLKLPSKDYSEHEFFTDKGRVYIKKGEVVERFLIHLVSPRFTNFPWGMENEVYRALKKMGYEVIDTDFRRDRKYLVDLLSQDAHLMIVIKGDGIPPELIMRQRCPVVLWYPDDVFSTMHARKDVSSSGFAYDIVYSFDKDALDEYRRLGVKDARWLPFATSPSVHKRLNLPKIHDISFVGNIYPNREILFERLKKRFNVFIKKAYMDEMVRIFNQSKIVLNLGIGKTGYNMRVFEALGCGGFLLTNEIPKGSRIFEDKRHLVYFNDDNIEDLIDYYLNHEDDRRRIAFFGYREVRRRHTYDHRVAKILEDIKGRSEDIVYNPTRNR